MDKAPPNGGALCIRLGGYTLAGMSSAPNRVRSLSFGLLSRAPREPEELIALWPGVAAKLSGHENAEDVGKSGEAREAALT
jgi:hypothetical protein